MRDQLLLAVYGGSFVLGITGRTNTLMDPFTPCLVYITAPSGGEAVELARRLVEERLAACCSVISGVRSFYHWEGSLQDDEEHLILCKTSTDAYSRLEKRIRSLHSAQVPEILMVPVKDGSAPYVDWMKDSLSDSAGL